MLKQVFCVGAMIAAMFMAFGCTSTSKVHFREPEGATLRLEDQEYTLPEVIELRQRVSPGAESMSRGTPVRMELPDGTRLRGFLHVYHINMDEVEELAEISFRLTQDQIEKLKDGHAVTVSGQSPRGRPVYKINLGVVR